MAVDRSKLEDLISEQVRAIEKTHKDDWEIGDVACIVEVLPKDGPMEVRLRHSGNTVVAVGLLGLARETIKPQSIGRIGEEGEQLPQSS